MISISGIKTPATPFEKIIAELGNNNFSLWDKKTGHSFGMKY
jgi:hypothetical protein